MRKKSTYIILISIIFIFGIIMFLVFGVENIKQGAYDSTIIVGDNTVWTYSNKKWVNVSSRASIDKLNWKTYKVYSNNEYLGDYLLWHDDRWYAFDKNKNGVNITGNILAYSANYNIDILNAESSDATVDNYVSQVLDDNNISLSSKFTSLTKTSVDFDGDGVWEYFYVVSNAFPIDFYPENIFSIVFVVKDGKVSYLYNDISKNNSFNGCKPYINTFLDTNNDGTYEMILSCGKYSVDEEVDMLYGYKENEFQILISNQ